MYNLSDIEAAAKGKPVVALVVHYEGRAKPVRYPWADRKKVAWANVRRCRLDFDAPAQHYIGNGEYGTRPGFRVKRKS